MTYLSLHYAIFTAALLAVYYLFSRIAKGRFQWVILLLGSLFFYYTWAEGILPLVVFAIPVGASWLGALLLGKGMAAPSETKRTVPPFQRVVFALTVLLTVLPLVLSKLFGFFPSLGDSFGSLVVPVGLSFYTLQLIAYVTDVYRGKIQPQRNPLKHLLFASFFPQVIQGPIPRYKEVGDQLFAHHTFAYDNLVKGALRIVWGFFLKLMIADKAAIFVSKVFDGNGAYVGGYILLAAVLYALQLYTDFYACTSISLGAAQLFGIELPGNFARPYFAVSVRDFWRRWHITLSTWLRDYLYIPLGGNRKGKLRKYLNILLVFIVSGLWHGTGLQFLAWGLMHGVYQIFGELTAPAREKCYALLRIRKDSFLYIWLKRAGVFCWVTLGWIFFRSASVGQGIRMIRDAFGYFNPWTLFGRELFALGLDVREFFLLILSTGVLILVGSKQERGARLQAWFLRQHLLLRWALLIGTIVIFWIFGTYGYGFDARDFIYGGF